MFKNDQILVMINMIEIMFISKDKAIAKVKVRKTHYTLSIVIPKPIAKKLSIKENDVLLLEADLKNKIIIIKKQENDN